MINVSSANHGILTSATLASNGASKVDIRRAVDDGQLARLRNGWYALPGTDERLARAVCIGGRATGSTALAMRKLWVMPDATLHVAVPANAARLRCPDDRHSAWDPLNHPDIKLHWSAYPWSEPASSPLASLATSLADLLRSVSLDDALVTIDSALNTRVDGRHMLTFRGLEALVSALPAKYAKTLQLADGRAQSGLETLARLRAKRRGIRVRIQVKVRGVGRIDVLIGDRFVLELDSRAHHLGDNYETDRTRDLELIAQGFIVLRVSYRRVMYDWDSIEAVILAVVRRGDHLRTGMHKRLGLALTLD